MDLKKIDEFLKTIDLKKYREQYSRIKIVEMDLSKNIQAIQLLYQIYWYEKTFLSFDDFYEKYLQEKQILIEEFRKKTTMCTDCFTRGLKARIYRTWASIVTQIHAGYVAESVFGKETVLMSEELDHKGVDFYVKYKGHVLNYQIKKTTKSGVMSRKPLSRKKILERQLILNMKYRPVCQIQKQKKASYECHIKDSWTTKELLHLKMVSWYLLLMLLKRKKRKLIILKII